MNSISTINVPFHGDNLYLVSYEGQPFVAMRPFIEGMGLDWASQYTKIKQRFKTCVVNITMQLPCDNQRRSVVCLALKKLTGWLHTININKVRAEIRDKVAAYQDRSDDVLYEYWTTGEVKNKRKGQKILPGKITAEQQEAIKQLVMTRGKALPKEKQAKAMITMWSSLKSHFGCTYKEIGSDKFTEALSLAARVPLEGEYIPAQEVLPEPVGITFTEDETLALVTMCNAANFAQQEAKEMYPAFVDFGSRFTGSIYDIAHSNGIFVRNGTKVLMDKLSGLRLSGKAWAGALNRLTMNA